MAAVAWTVVGVANWRRSSAARRGPAASVDAGDVSAAASDRHDSTTRVHRPGGHDVDRPGSRSTRSQGSTLTWRSNRRPPTSPSNRTVRPPRSRRDRDGRFAGRLTLTRTGYMVITAGDISRTIPIVVSPDALPSVRITVPGRDLVYAGGNPRITFDARATDDYGLRSLALHYTKVSGSGEQFEFKEGEIPLDRHSRDAREWRGARRAIARRARSQGRRHARLSRGRRRRAARRRQRELGRLLHRDLEARRRRRRCVHAAGGGDSLRAQPADADHQDRASAPAACGDAGRGAG